MAGQPVCLEHQAGNYHLIVCGSAFFAPPANEQYLKFLAEENRTDDRGKRLYEAWSLTGKCAPVVMAQIERTKPKP